jgi:DEAD/DEAH box helicase domain-containing protein
MLTEVIFDVETKKLFSEIESDKPQDLGVSTVSLYTRRIDDTFNEISGKIQSFWENEFNEMWPIFQKADRIIGFNSLGFDVPTLEPYTGIPFKKMPHFDIMQKVKEVLGRRISLDAIAKETLNIGKTESGLEAIKYWRKGDKESLKKLQKYCEDDVLITRDVYDYGLANGHVLFKDKWNTQKSVEIDFSYQKREQTDKQIGLF